MMSKNLHTTLARLSAGLGACCVAAAAQAETHFPIGSFQIEAKSRVGDTTLRLRLSRVLGEGRSVDHPMQGRAAAAVAAEFRETGRPLVSVELPREFVAQLAAESPYASERTISGEQFGVGGARTVRGFDERALADERGWQLGAELRSPPFGQWGRLALFVDRGAEARLSGVPGERPRDVVANWGIGWRYGRAGFAAVIDWAQVIDGDSHAARSDSKFRIQATLQF